MVEQNEAGSTAVSDKAAIVEAVLFTMGESVPLQKIADV